MNIWPHHSTAAFDSFMAIFNFMADGRKQEILDPELACCQMGSWARVGDAISVDACSLLEQLDRYIAFVAREGILKWMPPVYKTTLKEMPSVN